MGCLCKHPVILLLIKHCVYKCYGCCYFASHLLFCSCFLCGFLWVCFSFCVLTLTDWSQVAYISFLSTSIKNLLLVHAFTEEWAGIQGGSLYKISSVQGVDSWVNLPELQTSLSCWCWRWAESTPLYTHCVGLYCKAVSYFCLVIFQLVEGAACACVYVCSLKAEGSVCVVLVWLWQTVAAAAYCKRNMCDKMAAVCDFHVWEQFVKQTLYIQAAVTSNKGLHISSPSRKYVAWLESSSGVLNVNNLLSTSTPHCLTVEDSNTAVPTKRDNIHKGFCFSSLKSKCFLL